MGIYPKSEAGCAASNTCKAASNVADVLEGDQHDCEMHVVNLVMGYGLGVKENTKTKSVADEKGVVKKVQYMVTPGGAFPEGARLVETARKCVNYFSASPQRKGKLETQRIAMDLPQVTLRNFPETRVAYVVPTYQSLMANHCL